MNFTAAQISLLVANGWTIADNGIAEKLWFEIAPYGKQFVLRTWMLDDGICEGGYWETDTYDTLEEILGRTNRS